MGTLTIALVTSRHDPKFAWFFWSLAKQCTLREQLTLVVVDYFLDAQRTIDVMTKYAIAFKEHDNVRIKYVCPKHSIWKGEYQLPVEPWWSKSNDLNTAICLCQPEWIAFCDDRCVLMPGWLDCIREAMRENYAVCGTYEKRANMKVVDGVISDPGELLGADHRPQVNHTLETKDWYGGHGALPLEWCLRVNGFSEDICDSLGSEDSMFGMTLHNSGYPIRYDPRMKIVEDRTPGEIDGALKRADKGQSPRDKSHAIVDIFRDKTTSQNSFDIRNLRDRVLAGEPFPPPSASQYDWFDGQSIAEMT